MKISITDKTKKILWGVFTPLFWIILWQIAAMLIDSEVLLPYPYTVIKRLFEFSGELKFWITVGKSILRIFSGYITGILLGVTMAVICRKFTVNKLLSPLKTVIKATPVASFIMLAWVWFKRDTIPVFISMLMVIPVVWGNTETGINCVNRELKEFAQIYNLTWQQKLKHIYIPSVMPYFTSAACTCAGLVWKAGVAAEVLCQPKNSIGANLYNAKNILETADVFAWTAVVVLISVCLEKIIVKVIKKTEKGKRLK